MALAYTPPGVNVEELYSPSVNPLLSVSASVCLVGLARGYETGLIQVEFTAEGGAKTLTAPTGAIFQKVDSDTTFDAVLNVLDPTAGSVANQGGYEEATDFTAALSVDKKSVVVTPVDESDLDNNGGTLQFAYRYLSDKYFDPIRLDTQAAVESRFGPAFNTAGIVTPLSAAASLAFENGAASLVIQPLFKEVSGAPTQPSAAEAADDANWQITLQHLRDVEDINVIVPVAGQSDTGIADADQLAILQVTQDHIRHMETQGQYIVGIFGEDSSADLADASLATIRTHAGILRSRHTGLMAQQTVMVSPSRFRRALPSNNNLTLLVGGQYMAAAVAGMVAARPVVSPLTRKQVTGFVEVSMPDYDKVAKNADATAGLLVVEQKGTAVQVRHSVTIDNTSVANRELSVVRAKFRMIESIRQTIDDQIIGTVPADGNAPLVVKNAVISVLEMLQQRRELVDYTGVQARVLSNDPTTVECRFSYKPAFPLNYVNVVFSLDLSAGEVTTTTTETTV